MSLFNKIAHFKRFGIVRQTWYFFRILAISFGIGDERIKHLRIDTPLWHFKFLSKRQENVQHFCFTEKIIVLILCSAKRQKIWMKVVATKTKTNQLILFFRGNVFLEGWQTWTTLLWYFWVQKKALLNLREKLNSTKYENAKINIFHFYST